jgi:GGDEF domain-containing protein
VPDDPADDPLTGLYGPELFAVLASHHLRLSDRFGTRVVFVFVRLEGAAGDDRDRLLSGAADVVLDAVRASDVPGRIDDDTFCVLLTGDAEGAEGIVLSRLVDAIAARNASIGEGQGLSLSVGTAIYEPGSGVTLPSIIETAVRRLTPGSSDRA